MYKDNHYAALDEPKKGWPAGLWEAKEEDEPIERGGSRYPELEIISAEEEIETRRAIQEIKDRTRKEQEMTKMIKEETKRLKRREEEAKEETKQLKRREEEAKEEMKKLKRREEEAEERI